MSIYVENHSEFSYDFREFPPGFEGKTRKKAKRAADAKTCLHKSQASREYDYTPKMLLTTLAQPSINNINSVRQQRIPKMTTPLKKVLLDAKHPNYHELVMRLLFCTTIVAGDSHYRIREVEIYHVNDPYTHQGDEQVSSTGGWYFHRTKPGGGWKGGTFMGLDISFAPVGTAGGVLIRGISRAPQKKKNGDTYQYIDGSCNCVREFLKACGVSKIKDLVGKSNFSWDALSPTGIFRLMEHEPMGTMGDPNSKKAMNPNATMEWKAVSRIGLSEPSKFPEKAKERQKYHLAPLRFLQAPYETKKEKTKIKNATEVGIFSKSEYMKMNQASTESKTGKCMKPPAKKNSPPDALVDSSDEDEDYVELPPHLQPLFDDSKEEPKFSAKSNIPVWYYWLNYGMDGKKRGWQRYGLEACEKLEGFVTKKGKQLSRTTWHLKSGFFSYEIDVSKMTQRNMKSGTIRPIRRVLPGEICNLKEPPLYIPLSRPTNLFESSDDSDDESIKGTEKHKASWPTDSSSEKPAKKVKIESKHDDLKLAPLFSGKHGHSWESILTETIEAQPEAAKFIGPKRSKDILPIREMTFRALMAVAPEENNLVVIGQAPYPRVESASGIAMFDTLIKDWDCSQFGKTTSLRCIAKAAAIAKGIIDQDATVKTMRKVFKEKDIVTPPEWFQAMLAQGVLLLNASLTNGSDISTAQHTNFWKPVLKAIIQEILRAKQDKFPKSSPKRRIGFLWWGNESFKTKKFLAPVFEEYKGDVDITHIEHYNPAAQGDKFTQPPNHFNSVNKALEEGKLEPIDWLPNKDWMKDHHLDEHAAFITDTQELHKMYLDRLQAGLDLTELKPILGIMDVQLLALPEACDEMGLKSTAISALSKVQKFNEKVLDDNEKGAVYLYTTNVLYRRLNEALRNPNRSKVKVYFNYLRVFLQAYAKMKAKPRVLYRGINKDLSKQYAEGAKVVWWNVSSCTPNVNVAKNFGGSSSSGTMFHVKTQTAVPIMHLSAYQSEEEYILAPGTTLKVESVVKKPNHATEIYLEEIEGKRLVE